MLAAAGRRFPPEKRGDSNLKAFMPRPLALCLSMDNRLKSADGSTGSPPAGFAVLAVFGFR